MKVLIIQQKMIGDVLTSSILFEVLKDRFPISELHYLINEDTSAVLKNNPFIDKCKIVSKAAQKDKLKFIFFIHSLKSERYDVIIDAYGKISSLSICLGLKAHKKIGFSKSYTNFVYTHPIKRIEVPENNNSLAIENRLRLLKPLDIEFDQVRPKIYLLVGEQNEASNFLKSHGIDLNKPLYMISVLGSSPKKSYPQEHMAKLLDILCEIKDCQMLFNYIPGQFEEVKEIYELCDKRTQGAIRLDVYGKNLRSFMAITYFCDALIGNEGGAINMAKALNVPTFTIFSPHLNKHNWFGNIEEDKNVAVQLRDFREMDPKEIRLAKKNPKPCYLQLTPEMLKPQLKNFISHLQD